MPRAVYKNEYGETIAQSYATSHMDEIARKVGATYYGYRLGEGYKAHVEGWNSKTKRYRKITEKQMLAEIQAANV